MGIKFHCPACQKRLHVKSFLAGKRGVCPECGARLRIPLAAEGAAAEGPSLRDHVEEPGAASAGGTALLAPATRPEVADDPIAAAPDAVWYVRPAGGGQFGPANGTIMRRWIEEGRVGQDAHVWREGWEDWQPADLAFCQLLPTASAGQAVPRASVAAPADMAAWTADVSLPMRSAVTLNRATTRPPRSYSRTIAVVVILAVASVALTVALVLVLRSQG